MDHLGESNGLESVDSEIQSSAYKNAEVGHFAVATSLAWLAEERDPKSMAIVSVGNASSAELLLSLPPPLLLLLRIIIIM
jgi:hypothetical protein